jgi:heme A synthase
MERFHGFVGIPLIILLFGLGAWLLWQTAQKRPLDRPLVTSIYLVQALVIGQAVVGVLLMVSGGLVPAAGLVHVVLGTAAALLPGAAALMLNTTRSGNQRHFGSLGIMAVAGLTALFAFVTG